MKQQVVHRKATGLHSSSNPHQVPEGALAEAENVTIDQNIISKSRGFSRYGNQLSNPPSQLLQYKNRVLAHDGTALKYDSDGAGTWASYTGTFSAPATGHKIRSTEARRALYFTESDYPYRLDSLTGTPARAGMYHAPDIFFQATTNGTTWLPAGYFTSYKVVFVREDTNGRLIFGQPSPASWVENTAASAIRIWIYATTPQHHFAANDWMYIYRTPMSSTAAGLGSVYHFLEKYQIPSGVGAAGWTLIPDSTSDDFIGSGAELYTNPTKEGASQENGRPPHAKDVATYKGYTFYANYRQPHKLSFRCKQDGVMASTDTLTVTRGSDSQVFRAYTSNGAAGDFYLTTSGTASENVRLTFKDFAREASQLWAMTSPGNPFYASYTSDDDPDAPPGEVTVYMDDYSTTAMTVLASDATLGAAFSPDIYNSGSGATSSQDAAQHGLYYSKFEEPDAVPIGNVEYVGSEESEILRILPLRNSLIILKEEGVWRLSGNTANDFVIEEVDPSVRIDAPETAVVLNNAVFCSSNQGVVRIDEATGVSIVSRPVEDDLRQIQAFTNYSTIAHAASYESDRQYWLFVPETSSDTYATIAYVYNYIDGGWSTRRKDCEAAMVLHDNRKLYLAHAADSYVLEERKSLTGVADFVDELIDTTVSDHTTGTDSDGNTITVVTCSFTYTPHSMSKGWLFKYGSEEAIVTSYTDNGDGTYALTLSDAVTLPNLGTASTTCAFYDVLSFLLGGVSSGSSQATVAASLGIPIVSTVTWAEDGADNPSSMKQFASCQIDFDRNYAWKHELAFTSNFIGDRDHGTTFEIRTPGWGTGGWDGSPWAAASVPASPIRTVVPRDQQRAQWIQPTYKHYGAKETFDITSMALTFRTTGDKGVRKP